MTHTPVEECRRTAIQDHPSWLAVKSAAGGIQSVQVRDGSVPAASHQEQASVLVDLLSTHLPVLSGLLPHDARYHEAVLQDLASWRQGGFGVPDFLDSLRLFQPQKQRTHGTQHVVLFPMYTQNGSTNRHLEAVLVEVIWPEFIARLEAEQYSNPQFVPLRFLDFTAGYDTNSAVLFPESVAVRQALPYTWGAIFADREAARYRRVVTAAAEITHLELPQEAASLLADQRVAEETFVMWDLIHDRTHMRGDLPFDPFMIKQRMPYFLYALEELRCDLTAFREAVVLAQDHQVSATTRRHAALVQYAIIFDRIFRFPLTGTRVRNYDGLGGQLLFAWMHQHGVLHWRDTRLRIDWTAAVDVVVRLGEEIDQLYWRSIDRPRIAHWLAAHQFIAATLTAHPASRWAWAPAELPWTGPARDLTDAVLDDEFPLSMFFEALGPKLRAVIESTEGITGGSTP